MDDKEFNEIASSTRLSRNSREAARLVFVDGLSQTEAANHTDLSRQRINQIVNIIRKAEEEKTAQYLDMVSDSNSITMLAILNASESFAIKAIRDHFGDDALIKKPEPNQKYFGECFAKTEFHLTQSLGKNTAVIHELAKLDRVPSVGHKVEIQYNELGHATIFDVSKKISRDVGR